MKEPRDLVVVTEAARMLAEASTVDDIKRIVDLAEGARLYAKKARMGLDAQNSAASIRIEAEAKAGDLLRRMAQNGQRQMPATAVRTDLVDDHDEVPVTLDDMGINRDESSRYQAVAAIPPRVRADYVSTATVREEEVTRAGLTRYAAGHETRPAPRPVNGHVNGKAPKGRVVTGATSHGARPPHWSRALTQWLGRPVAEDQPRLLAMDKALHRALDLIGAPCEHKGEH